MNTQSIALTWMIAAPLAQPAAMHAAGLHPAALERQAASEDPAALIARGRELLEAGQTSEALTAFEAAERAAPDKKAARVWVLRAWIEQGRVNEALPQIEALEKAGLTGAGLDYLYGMAFARKAQGYVAEGVAGGIISMAFTDAVEYLQRATKADPAQYWDAFLTLAEAAWNAQQLDLARAAAEKAVELRPRSVPAALQLGRVAFSQYVALRAESERAEQADAAWKRAREAFTSAAELAAKSTRPEGPAQRIEALQQVGWLHVWKEQGDEAARAFGAAIAADPAAIDFGALRGALTAEVFAAALEAGQAAWQTNQADGAPPNATLLWWLGYARYAAKSYAEAEQAFARAVAAEPSYFNSWHYIALARYYRQDYDGTIAALREHHARNAADCVASLRFDEAGNLRILDYLIGLKAARAANLDASFLSELQTALKPEHDRYWNNLGLFLRDEGEVRLRRTRKPTDEQKAEIRDLMERAFTAYKRALELAPGDPNYLNDAALMLHYHLDRDLDQARAWYVKAAERAEAELARKDIPAELRELRKIALRDAGNNLRLLDELIAKRKQAEEERKRREAQGEKPTPTPEPPPTPDPPPGG